MITILIISSCILSAQPYEGEKGDVDNNGDINVLDMLKIANKILGIINLNDQETWRADCNAPEGNCDGDGSANVLDMVKIANIILGTDECLETSCTTVTDIDGNTYQTIQIGDQCWMAENLKVTHYRNGDAILHITGNTDWKNLSTGAYCNYINDTSYVVTYGRLYNWYAVADSRGMAPEGWHVPSDPEWRTLVDYLGGFSVAGGKLKTTGTIEGGTGLWYSPNTGATNESGFSGLPGGFRSKNSGGFFGLGRVAYFWSSTEYIGDYAWSRPLHYNNVQVFSYSISKRRGFSVRCVKD